MALIGILEHQITIADAKRRYTYDGCQHAVGMNKGTHTGSGIGLFSKGQYHLMVCLQFLQQACSGHGELWKITLPASSCSCSAHEDEEHTSGVNTTEMQSTRTLLQVLVHRVPQALPPPSHMLAGNYDVVALCETGKSLTLRGTVERTPHSRSCLLEHVP